MSSEKFRNALLSFVDRLAPIIKENVEANVNTKFLTNLDQDLYLELSADPMAFKLIMDDINKQCGYTITFVPSPTYLLLDFSTYAP